MWYLEVKSSDSIVPCPHISPYAVRPGCDHGSIRLLGGSSGVEGAVQICINGVWGSIMFSGGWTFSEARVVCRMLGHNEYGIYITQRLRITYSIFSL